MKSTDNVGIAFANLVVALGRYNHNVNVSLAAYQWTPDLETEKVHPDPAITCRLRMDDACALQLLEMLADRFGKKVVDDEGRKLPPAGLVHGMPQPGEAVN